MLSTMRARRLGPANGMPPEAEVSRRRGAPPDVFLDSPSLFSFSLATLTFSARPTTPLRVCVCVCALALLLPDDSLHTAGGHTSSCGITGFSTPHSCASRAACKVCPCVRLHILGVGRAGLSWRCAGETRGHDPACISSLRAVSAIEQRCASTSCFTLLFQLRCGGVERKHELSVSALCSGVTVG